MLLDDYMPTPSARPVTDPDDDLRLGAPAMNTIDFAAGFYFNPASGEPTAERFADEVSSAGSRLFGQGAELRLQDYKAYYR
jgi:hypothetical protein